MNTTWVFGESSEFSKKLIEEANKKDDTVCTFGRRCTDYKDIALFLKKYYKDQPTKIIINAKTDFELEDTRHATDITFKYITPIQTISFLADILNFIGEKASANRLPVTVVYITSSATTNSNQSRKTLWRLREYIGLRHIQQAAMSACDTRYMQVLGVSPSYMDNSNIDLYSKQVIDILYNPPEVRRGLADLHFLDKGWISLYGLKFHE